MCYFTPNLDISTVPIMTSVCPHALVLTNIYTHGSLLKFKLQFPVRDQGSPYSKFFHCRLSDDTVSDRLGSFVCFCNWRQLSQKPSSALVSIRDAGSCGMLDLSTCIIDWWYILIKEFANWVISGFSSVYTHHWLSVSVWCVAIVWG